MTRAVAAFDFGVQTAEKIVSPERRKFNWSMAIPIARDTRAIGGNPLVTLLRDQVRIWYALMLHDIKARFFGNGLGYILTIAWPLAHIIVILVINAGRLPAHGSSMVLYAATAVVPFIAANYIGRFIMIGVLQNKSFLQYPIIKPLDIMIAKGGLEIINNFLVVVIVLFGLTMMGINVMPIDVSEAAQAWGCAILLGVGLGILNGVITMAMPMWATIYVLFIIGAWATCGLTIDPEALPAPYGYYMSFNPVMHLVEWMRHAYYPDFPVRLLDKSYVITFAVVCLGIGLVAERLSRSFLIQMR